MSTLVCIGLDVLIEMAFKKIQKSSCLNCDYTVVLPYNINMNMNILSQAIQLILKENDRCNQISWASAFYDERNTGIILYMGQANGRRCYIVMLSLNSWVHTQKDPWEYCLYKTTGLSTLT